MGIWTLHICLFLLKSFCIKPSINHHVKDHFILIVKGVHHNHYSSSVHHFYSPLPVTPRGQNPQARIGFFRLGSEAFKASLALQAN